MYAFRGGVGESLAEHAVGGLAYDDCGSDDDMKDSDEEDRRVNNGDGTAVDDDNDGEDTPAAASAIAFPVPAPAITYSADGTEFRFNKALIPPKTRGLPPQIMNGAATLKEETARQKACISFQSFVPGPVAASPMVALIESIVVAPPPKAGAPAFKPEAQIQPAHPRYMSVLKTCYQLQQFKMACYNGLIPLAPGMTKAKVEALNVLHGKRCHQIGAEHDDRLDALYAGAKARVQTEVVTDFLRLCEDHALDYIHLLEYFLYACLILPRMLPESTITLANVLTPRDFPSLDACRPDQRADVVADTVSFFAHKEAIRANQEALNRKEKREDVDYNAMPLTSAVIASLLEKSSPTDVYKGYLPWRTAVEYLFYLDTDGTLSGKQ
jgi:hypothetical protein